MGRMEKKARYEPGRRPARGARRERVAEGTPAGRPVRAAGPSLLRVMTVELVASFVFFLAFVLAASQPGAGLLTPVAVAWTLILADMLDRNSLWVYALAGIGSACAAAAFTLWPRSRNLQRTKSNPQDLRAAKEGTVPCHSESQ